MFGYPVPQVPKLWADGARDSVAILKQKSSVEAFGAVQDVLDGDATTGSASGGQKEKRSDPLRGESLRNLEDFFKEHDTGRNYAGLKRIADGDGTAIWTALEDKEQIEQALQDRADERRGQERAEEQEQNEETSRMLMLKVAAT